MTEQNFAFLHFLNKSGCAAALMFDGSGWDAAANLKEITAELTLREKRGTYRFWPLNTAGDRHIQESRMCVVHDGARAEVYPLALSHELNGKQYFRPQCGVRLYVLQHTELDGVVVADHSTDYVCTGCYGDIRYEQRRFVHAYGTPLCEYYGINGRMQDGAPIRRETAEWACRRKAAKLYPFPCEIPVQDDGRLDVAAFRRDLVETGVDW